MPVRQRRIRTLVVDDSAVAVRSMCSVLDRQSEVEVVGTAQDGREALALVHTLHPELVLLDVQMPVMNGIEAAIQLGREFPAVRVIMITGYDTPEIRQACRDCGAQGFIPKEHLNEEFPAILHQLFGPGERVL